LKRVIHLLLACVIGFTAQSAIAADTKIGFIDGNKIIQKYEPQIDAKLQDEFKASQEKIVSLQKKLVEQSDKYKLDSAVMSEAELAALKKDFEKNQADFQRLSADYNQKRGARGNEELNKLLEDVKNAAKGIAAKEGYGIILQRGAAVYITNEADDITDKVMKQLSYK
jgi:outer membrane protein